MSYINSPFLVMVILFIMSVGTSFGIVTLLNKLYNVPWKYDVGVGSVIAIGIWITAMRMIF